ncbi:MAG: hypothetical protein LH654_06790 [Thermoleophilia bacterium]|nr:hypothetical protein [Thermoleophilia bacterium]
MTVLHDTPPVDLASSHVSNYEFHPFWGAVSSGIWLASFRRRSHTCDARSVLRRTNHGLPPR